MIRFAVGFFVGLSCAGWVAAHPEAAHAIGMVEHAVGIALGRSAAAIGRR
jgi:hypothetical protein